MFRCTNEKFIQSNYPYVVNRLPFNISINQKFYKKLILKLFQTIFLALVPGRCHSNYRIIPEKCIKLIITNFFSAFQFTARIPVSPTRSFHPRTIFQIKKFDENCGEKKYKNKIP